MSGAKAALRILAEEIASLESKENQLEQILRETQAKATEDSQRAAMHEARANEYQAKAARLDQVERAAQTLLEFLSELPLQEDQLTMIPGATNPIKLYGSYDWQAVMNAARVLTSTMKETE